MIKIPDFFIDEIKKSSLDFENRIKYDIKRHTGSYYTPLDLAIAIVKELIENLPIDKKNRIYSLKFLEPCVGSGNFVIAYIILLQEYNFSKEQYEELFNNIYVCDTNIEAIKYYKNLIYKIAYTYFDIILDDYYFDTHTGGSLIYNIYGEIKYISLNDIFGSNFEKSFDIVITNPPYKNLKAEKSTYNNENEYNFFKKQYKLISSDIVKHMKYSIDGTINFYKIFIEEIIEKYTNSNAMISLLISSSILTDKTCKKIRDNLIKKTSIISIKIIPERNTFINAQQGLSIFLLKKGDITSLIKINNNYTNIKDDTYEKIYHIHEILFNNNLISILDIKNYLIIKKLDLLHKIKDLNFIYNMRGELDLTLDKKYITSNITDYKLIRGRNISYYELKNLSNINYVVDNFIYKTKKLKFILSERLACQQISNISNERRLNFTLIPKNYILANSCNYIVVEDNNYNIDLYFLIGILNSSVINLYFKFQSSNNHINNYEIDNIPIPINYKNKLWFSNIVKTYIETKDINIMNNIDNIVKEMYFNENINLYNEYINFLEKEINLKNNKLYNNYILNHKTFKLSDLDIEMISEIPQGGNWKNIPESIIKKSKRLTTISKTGGRTTLYGRIDYKKPSYTITTYFNRPGNGTYVHPLYNRVISIREAARLQGFPDHYYFYGNQRDILNQVGNAVPPILAYQIAKQIIKKIDCKYSLDLFCGAGGLTYGFKLAGIKSLISNDIDKSACLTLKINNPEINILCGDIRDIKVKENIFNQLSNYNNVDIICGGPPCQGFSMAGYRSIDDNRNSLFIDFIDIVSNIMPKVIVFENVEGIISFQNGKIYNNILNMFKSIGYNVFSKILLASQYAVPQNRKRVIIVCVRKDINVMPEDLYPEELIKNQNNFISTYEAISDLEDIECSENATYKREPKSFFAKFVRGKISIDEYISIYKN